MTSPLPPESPGPLDETRLRGQVREILKEILAANQVFTFAPTGPPPQAVPGREGRRLVVLVTALGVVIAAAALQLTLKAGIFSGEHQVPDDLVGVWRTSATRYADHALTITKTSIAFDAGGGGYPVQHIVVVGGGVATLYTIRYTTADDQAGEFSVYYSARGGGEIRFKNQRQLVWKRALPQGTR